MMSIFWYSLIYSALFTISELLYYKAHWKVESTRKFVHVFTGFIALTFPVYLVTLWHVGVLCVLFLMILFLAEKYQYLKSITAIKRKSYGSILFSIVVFMCFGFSHHFDNTVYYYLPILVLSLSDPLAAIIGKKTKFIPYRIFNQTKTIGGSLGFLISSFCIILYFTFSQISIYEIIFIAIITTLVEALCIKGLDNLTIPLSLISLLYLFGF